MSQDNQALPPPAPPNLIERLAFSLGFSVVAYLALGLIFALAVAQFVLRAVGSEPNGELAAFLRRLTRYLAEVCAYVALVSDERPFPFGAFPADGRPQG